MSSTTDQLRSSTTPAETLNPNSEILQFGFFVMCGVLWRKLKNAAKSDWLSMVMPSIFTKTFGRALMVSGAIQYTTPVAFILQNLAYAAWPIALIAGLVVGYYRYVETYKLDGNVLNELAGAELRTKALRRGFSFFVKTAVKFFIVYMSWVSAMALVTSWGWFAPPMIVPALILVGGGVVALTVLALLKAAINRWCQNEVARHLLSIMMVATVFIMMAGAAYYVSPLLMGLLVIGGTTSLSLFFASVVTDVLPDPKKNIAKAWGMLARAYAEGVVWALVEHLGLNVLVGGFFGGLVDVFCVAAAVCLAIFIGGQVDEHVKHLRESKKKIVREDLENIRKALESIKDASLANWKQIKKSIDYVRQSVPDNGCIHYFDRLMQYELTLKVLTLLSQIWSADEVDTCIPAPCLTYLRQKSATGFFTCSLFAPKTYKMVTHAIEKRKGVLQHSTSHDHWLWNDFRTTVIEELDTMSAQTQFKLFNKHGINLNQRHQVDNMFDSGSGSGSDSDSESRLP